MFDEHAYFLLLKFVVNQSIISIKINATFFVILYKTPVDIVSKVNFFPHLSENPYISLRCCFKYNNSKQPCEATQHFSKLVGSGGIFAVR